jgi:hypothetical protein
MLDVRPGTVQHARREALASLASALRERRVPFFLVPGYTGAAYRLGVLDQHHSEVVQAINRLEGGDWFVKAGAAAAVRAKRWRASPDDTVVTAFRRRIWPDSPFRLGPESGVRIEFWAEIEGGWSGPVPNSVARIVSAGAQHEVAVDVGGAGYPTLAGLAARPWDDIDFPVDVVYTWVDGSDPKWQAARDRRLADCGGESAVSVESRADSRFTDHDELRHSLRSLEQFLPWVRTVYLVTAGQRPSWLAHEHPNLQVVDHRDILEAEALPTFSSLAIETALHHIDGLSEQFLYVNDDVFAARPLEARTFFHANGAPKFFVRTGAGLDPSPPDPDDLPVTAANKNVRALIERDFGRRIGVLMRHSPHPLRRSLLNELEERYPEDIRRTRRHPFRMNDDVTMVTTLHHYYGYYSGQAMPGLLRHVGVVLGRDDVERRLEKLLSMKPDTFNLNDSVPVDDERDRQSGRIQEFLRGFFPEPSGFEV